MKFNEVLNRYLKELDCTAKKLSIESGLSESVISRYRNGERTPKANSKQLKSISNALETMLPKEKFSTCTVENPHIINSIYFRSIIKENDFNGKDQDRIYSNNYHSRW